MDWLVEEISLRAFTRTTMSRVAPGAMSSSTKVEVSLSTMRESDGATVATGETSLVEPAFLKEMVTSRVSSGAMGLSMAERVTSTTGWGVFSRPRAGMAILSVMLPWMVEILLL